MEQTSIWSRATSLKNGSIKLAAAAFAIVLMANGEAMAQSRNSAAPSTAPWYERFTFGSEIDSGVNAWAPRGEPKATIRVSPRSRWGVTFGMQEESQRPLDRRNGQTSAGAFYDLTPKVRVGGQVVVPQDGAVNGSENRGRGPSLKVESAFRF